MDIIAVQKFVKVSPKKMRVVADVARKLSPLEALEKLPFLRKRGSESLLKTLKSAFASAKQKGLSDNTLSFKEIQIGEGPRLKRGRAASRGRWHPFKRRTSHIRIILQTAEKQASLDHSSKEVVSESTPEIEKKPVKNNIFSKVKKAVAGTRKVENK